MDIPILPSELLRNLLKIITIKSIPVHTRLLLHLTRFPSQSHNLLNQHSENISHPKFGNAGVFNTVLPCNWYLPDSQAVELGLLEFQVMDIAPWPMVTKKSSVSQLAAASTNIATTTKSEPTKTVAWCMIVFLVKRSWCHYQLLLSSVKHQPELQAFRDHTDWITNAEHFLATDPAGIHFREPRSATWWMLIACNFIDGVGC